MTLLIKEEIKTPWTVVKLSGKIDVITAPELEEVLNRCYHEGKSDVAIDFQEVDYLSSSGIRVLLIQHKKYAESNRKFNLVTIPSHILEIIQLAGFNTVFSIRDRLTDISV